MRRLLTALTLVAATGLTAHDHLTGPARTIAWAATLAALAAVTTAIARHTPPAPEPPFRPLARLTARSTDG